MVLDKQRDNVDPFLSKIAKYFSKVNPDVLTWSSLVFAVVAGIFFYFSTPKLELVNYFLYGAVFFVFLNGFFDAIDGKVAKITNKTSMRGDFLDHAIDRYADVFMVGGLALSSWCIDHPSIGLLAVVGMTTLCRFLLMTQNYHPATQLNHEYVFLLPAKGQLLDFPDILSR